MQWRTRRQNALARGRENRKDAKRCAAAWSTDSAARQNVRSPQNACDDPTAERFGPSMTFYSLVLAHEANPHPRRSGRMHVDKIRRRRIARPHVEEIRRCSWAFRSLRERNHLYAFASQDAKHPLAKTCYAAEHSPYAPFRLKPASLLHLAVPGQHIVQRGEQAKQQAGVHEPNTPRACLGTEARQPGCFKPTKPTDEGHVQQ